MKKILEKAGIILSLLLFTVLLSLGSGTVVRGTSLETAKDGKQGSITLLLSKDAKGVEITLWKIADYQNGNYVFSNGFENSGVRITNLKDAGEAQAAADTLTAYALQGGIAQTDTQSVDETGQLIFKNLSPALYLAGQTSGTDGVGTKLKLAFIMDKHDTVGIDCVAMCVNDIACAGGEPLFFLDYIACGKNYPEKIAEIVKGVAEGCSQSSAALIGGETAEMPGFYPVDEYDLAGFAVGVVDKKDLITGENLNPGDVLIGMASSGVHSNGFSLVRKVFEMTKESLDTYYEELGTTLGKALIAPTKIYVKALKSIKDAGVKIHACSHITGGGFYENVPRMLKEGTRAVIEKDSYPVLPIFKLLAKTGDIEEKMMYNTYNMGLGMIMAVDPADVDKTMEAIKAAGETPYVVGRIEAGEKGVTLC